jgi:hypothetical protein
MGRQGGTPQTATGDQRGYPPFPLLLDDEVLEQQPDQASLTGRYLSEAIRFLRAGGDQPFFLYLAHLYVHLPIYSNNSPRWCSICSPGQPRLGDHSATGGSSRRARTGDRSVGSSIRRPSPPTTRPTRTTPPSTTSPIGADAASPSGRARSRG